jgi:hypothetical protein
MDQSIAAAMRAAHTAGASADVLMALFEELQKIGEARRAKDRERKRLAKIRGKSRNSAENPGIPRNSAEATADPPPTAGPPSAEPLGIESVDKVMGPSEEGLTNQRKVPPNTPSKESFLFPSLPLFDDLSNSQEKKEVDTRARGAALFAKFWQAYPHKVGKRDAATSFQRILKMGIVGIDDLMAGLARYAAKTDDRPWCNPATWLNGGRWDDQPAAVNGNHQTGGNNGFQTNRGAGGAVRMRIALARKRAAASSHTDQEEGGFAAPLQSRD